jgi:hypothetical protein
MRARCWDLGCDASCSSTWLRSAISHAIRNVATAMPLRCCSLSWPAN